MEQRQVGNTRSAESRPPANDASPDSAQTTISQLIARILDQLSVSAWFPAAGFVFLLLLIGAVRHAGGDVAAAVTAIASMSLSSVVLLVAAVILATTLAQAFEFEAIRVLEGYWGPGRVPVYLAEMMCRWQTWRRARLIRRHDRAAEAAFDAALPNLIQHDVPAPVIKILRARVYQLPVRPVSPDDLVEADQHDWLADVPASPRRRLDALSAALRRYPTEEFRILPSRLGNTLRHHEERIHDIGVGELETFVQTVFHRLPASIQVEHDQFRSRLDLYCSLVVVFALTGIFGIVQLAKFGVDFILTTGGLAGALMVLSYRAAIASARPYGGLLEVIGDITRREV